MLSNHTLSGESLLLEDVEAVLSAAGVELLALSGVTWHLQQRHVVLQRVAQVVAVTKGQRVKGSHALVG